MKKTKDVHFRVSDTLYEQLSEKALKNGTSISNLSREILDKSISEDESNTGNKEYLKEDDPFKHARFIYLILWIHEQSNKFFLLNSTTSLEKIQFLKNVLDFYIVKLDPFMRVLFNNIKIDLDRIIEESSVNSNYKLKFNKVFEKNYRGQ